MIYTYLNKIRNVEEEENNIANIVIKTEVFKSQFIKIHKEYISDEQYSIKFIILFLNDISMENNLNKILSVYKL